MSAITMFSGITRKHRRIMHRYRSGINSGSETFMRYADGIFHRVLRLNTAFYERLRISHLRKSLWHEEDNSYHIKGVRLPVLDAKREKLLMLDVLEDSLGGYFYFGDKYDDETVSLCDKVFDEGVYGLVNDKVNVTVEPGDIVIDAGSWIGDFAAYASVKGATAYAFEPEEGNFAILQETARLNGNIIPVRKGLSDENTSRTLFVEIYGNSGRNSLVPDITSVHKASSSKVETVRLDDFVRENNLPRVDFIKSDIEGFERNMLAGAQETLAKFAPKLALCTYHLPDDPQVMAGLIKQANPKYNIVQKHCKLFASVPEE